MLLQKTLFQIEGLGRRLYPDLDLWVTAKPFLEQWTREHMGPRALLKTLRRELPKWWEAMPQVPALIHQILTRAQHEELVLNWKSVELERLRRQLGENYRRLYGLVVALAFITTGAMAATLPWWGVATVPAVVPVIGSMVAGIGLLLFWRYRPKSS